MSVECRAFQRGMSLIELLLAVVLGLLLLAGLGRLLAYGQPLQQSMVRQAERQEHRGCSIIFGANCCRELGRKAAWQPQIR